MYKYYLGFFLMIVTFCAFLGINVLQTNRCRNFENKVKKLEAEQKEIISKNKELNNDITNLLYIDNLVDEAESLGLEKINPDDVIFVILGGKGHGL